MTPNGKNLLCVALLGVCFVFGHAAVIQPERMGEGPPYSSPPKMLGSSETAACTKVTLSTKVDFRTSDESQITVRWFFGSTVADNSSDLCWVPLHCYVASGCSSPSNGAFNFSADCTENTVFVAPDAEYGSYLGDNGDLEIYPGCMDAGIYAFYVEIGNEHFTGAWNLQVTKNKSCHSDYGIKFPVIDNSAGLSDVDSEEIEEDSEEQSDNSGCQFPETAEPKTWSDICTLQWGNHGSRLFEWPSCLGPHKETTESIQATSPVLVANLQQTNSESI